MYRWKKVLSFLFTIQQDDITFLILQLCRFVSTLVYLQGNVSCNASIYLMFFCETHTYEFLCAHIFVYVFLRKKIKTVCHFDIYDSSQDMERRRNVVICYLGQQLQISYRYLVIIQGLYCRKGEISLCFYLILSKLICF